MLSYEDNLLHAVAILLVPVGTQGCVAFHHLCQFVFRHCGKPLSCLTDAYLFTCLFEEVAHIQLVVEIADTLGANHALGPFASHEVIKESQFEGTATIIYEGSYTIFLSLALIVMMVVMVVVMVMLVLIVVVIIMVVMVMVMMLMLVVVVIVVIIVLVLFVMALNLLNPGC